MYKKIALPITATIATTAIGSQRLVFLRSDGSATLVPDGAVCETTAVPVGGVITAMPGDGGDSAAATIALRLESVSRFNRCRSVRMSDACWYRKLRSFSSALLIMSSSLAGSSGFRRTGAVGALCRMESNIAAEVSPRKGREPVDIS